MNTPHSFSPFKRRFMGLALGLSATALLLACGAKPAADKPAETATAATPTAAPGEAVRVASKIDNEGGLLGNIVLQVLESKGIPTVNKVQLGATKVVRAALEAGEIDLYPEYTGNGAFLLGDEASPAWKDAKAGYELAKKMDYDKNKIVWLQPAPANNTFAIALRSDVAQANNIKSIEDLSKWMATGGQFKIAASAESVERPDALPSFEKTYGLKFKQDNILVLAGGDTTVFIKAAAEKTSGVNAALAYGTDGALSSLGLVVLDDPKSAQPIYAPAPLVRESVLKKYPEIETALKPVFESLDTVTLQGLNAKIAIEGQDPKMVAAEYLKSKGFIK